MHKFKFISGNAQGALRNRKDSMHNIVGKVARNCEVMHVDKIADNKC